MVGKYYQTNTPDMSLEETKDELLVLTNIMIDAILALEITALKIQKMDRTNIEEINMSQWYRKLINRSELMLDNVSSYENFLHDFRIKLKSKFRVLSLV